MRSKSLFEKVTDVMLVGGLVGIAFCVGVKYGEKRGARR